MATGQQARKYARLIQEIAEGKKSLRFPVMSGTVVAGSTDTDNLTCNVVLSVDKANAPHQGIMLNAVTMNTNGMILYPADNSNVWVAEIDGPSKWGIIKCSDLVKMQVTIGASVLTITDGLIQMNDGSEGGLVKVEDLVTRLNNVEADLNTLKDAFTAWVVVPNDGGAALKGAATAWYGAALTETVRGDIENTNVKQG